MEIKKEYDFNDLRDECWSGALNTLDTIYDRDKTEELMSLMETVFSDETPTLTEINDWLWFEWEEIYKDLDIYECEGEYKITDIMYDIGDEDLDLDRDDYETEEEYEQACEDAREDILSSLPEELIVEVQCSEDELVDVLSDKISDETGWCVLDFNYKEY